MKPIFMISKLLLVSMFAIFFLSGCNERIIDFTIISSKQMAMNVKPEGKGTRVVGKDGVYWLVTIPLGAPNLKEAVDRAIESAGPGYDGLIDGVCYFESWWAFITGYSGYRVEGTPIKTSELRTLALMEGKDPELATANVIFHSSRGISNADAIKKIAIVKK